MIEHGSGLDADTTARRRARYEAGSVNGTSGKASPSPAKVVETIKIEGGSRLVENKNAGDPESGKYLYSIIPYREEVEFGKIGILGAEVYVMRCLDFAGVISDAVNGEYELTEANVKRHDEVLRHLLESYTVLPAEFGTVLQSGRVLTRLLKKANDHIMEGLRLVEDSVELGVKAVVRKEVVDTREDADVKPDEILGPLKCLAVKSVSGDLFSDRLIFNESFLVKKEGLATFSRGVEKLRSTYPMVRLLYSGPWAPYNFVHIRIGKDGIEFK